MRENRLRQPLMALRDRLKGGATAARSAAAAKVAAEAFGAKSANTAAFYYPPPPLALQAGSQRYPHSQQHHPLHQILSDQLYETVHPLLFASAAPSSTGSGASDFHGGDGDGDSLVLAGHAAANFAAPSDSSVSTVPDSSGGQQRRANCDCDFCQRVAAASFSPAGATPLQMKAPPPRVASAAWSDVNRSETIDWYNVSAEIEAAAAAAANTKATAAGTKAAASTADAGSPVSSDSFSRPIQPSQPRLAAPAVGDSTREFFGEDVRLMTQASAAPAGAHDTSTPLQPPQQPQSFHPSASPMPPYSRQLLARLLAEPSPSSTATNTNTSELCGSSPSIDSFAAAAPVVPPSPLLHNSPQLSSAFASPSAPVNPGLADLDFSPTGSAATADATTASSSLLSATLPLPAKFRPRQPSQSASSASQRWRSPSSSSYKSSMIPSSTESSLSGHRTTSVILTPPPGFGSPAADVTVVAAAEDSERSGSGSAAAVTAATGGGGGHFILRHKILRRTLQGPLKRANAFARKLDW